MIETVNETVESNNQPTGRSFFKRPLFWIILLCLVAIVAFAVWKKQQTPATAAGKPGAKGPVSPRYGNVFGPVSISAQAFSFSRTASARSVVMELRGE